MANIYIPTKNGLPNEELRLVITTNLSYRNLKGILDALSAKLHLKDYAVTPTKKIISGKIEIGTVLQPTPHVHVADISVKSLRKISSTHPRYVPVIDHPPVIEDLTFTLSPKTHVGPLIEKIKATSTLIESVNLKDIFEQNFTFTITYRHPNKSLTDRGIAPIRKNIVATMEKSFNSKLVGTLL